MTLAVSLTKVCQSQAGMLAHGCAFEFSLLRSCACVDKLGCVFIMLHAWFEIISKYCVQCKTGVGGKFKTCYTLLLVLLVFPN